MKKFILTFIIIGGFFVQSASQAAVVVTIGKVTGVNTNLDVKIEGSGTIPAGEDPLYIGVYDLKEHGVKSQTHFFAKGAESNIGDYVSSLYNFYAVELISPITLVNTTDSTSTQIEYLLMDDDGVGPNDDFNMLFFEPDAWIEPGDSWMISGYSQIALGKGNSSIFNLGTYSYTDDSIGDVTLNIQSNPAVIPETSTALSIIIGGALLMMIRRQKIA